MFIPLSTVVDFFFSVSMVTTAVSDGGTYEGLRLLKEGSHEGDVSIAIQILTTGSAQLGKIYSRLYYVG